MQNKFTDNDNFSLFHWFLHSMFVSTLWISRVKVILGQVEIWLRKSNSCQKWFNLMSPKLFGLLMIRNAWNFGSIIFEVQTATGRWVWSPIMCRIHVLTSSNWTDQKIQNFGNHTIETKMLYIYTKSNYIETISLLIMVSKNLNF